METTTNRTIHQRLSKTNHAFLQKRYREDETLGLTQEATIKEEQEDVEMALAEAQDDIQEVIEQTQVIRSGNKRRAVGEKDYSKKAPYQSAFFGDLP